MSRRCWPADPDERANAIIDELQKIDKEHERRINAVRNAMMKIGMAIKEMVRIMEDR